MEEADPQDKQLHPVYRKDQVWKIFGETNWSLREFGELISSVVFKGKIE